MKKFFNFRRIVTLLLILLPIISSTALAFLICKDNPILERLCWSFQTVSAIFVIAGVVIAVWQYYLSSRDSRINLEIVQVQRAIDLSEYYKDNILAYYPAIRFIYENSGIMEYFNKIRPEQMISFDFQELHSLFTEEDIDNLKKIPSEDKFTEIVVCANTIYDLGLNIFGTSEQVIKNGTKETTIIIDKYSVASAFMSNLILKVLNNMEFFALHFNHGTADESVVYQSLHASYMEIVYHMYYYIARDNTKTTDKLYTNVIWLYDTWRERKKNQEVMRSNQAKQIESHGTRIQNDN